MNEKAIQITEVKPDVYAIEIEATADGQSVRRRYEAPSINELGRLAMDHV